ncbi:MAG: hypothetical protein H6R04_712 [Burkholderiaceae bacterium]|nr:hypothetical protein [Burkholderiaceae bacterium]
MRKYLAALATTVFMIAGCSDGTPNVSIGAPLDQYIKSIAPNVKELRLHQMAVGTDGKFKKEGGKATYNVELHITQPYQWDSAQDWNSLAGRIHKTAKLAFERDDVDRLWVRVFDKSGADWAVLTYHRKELPQNFKELSYQESFAFANAVPAIVQSQRPLCEFYAKYQSARPLKNHGC